MAQEKHLLQAEVRKTFGRKVKKLRAGGLLPANIFGSHVKSEAIEINTKDFLTTYQAVGDTGLIELTIKGDPKTRPVLVHLVQINPVSDQPIHVDFHQVDLTQKILADVPIELIGESLAVDQKGGILVQVMDEIQVEALPTDLPGKFELDITSLQEIGDALHVSDLQVDTKKVTLQTEPSELVVKIEAPKAEEEVVAPPPETEVITAKEGQEKELAEEKTESSKPASDTKTE